MTLTARKGGTASKAVLQRAMRPAFQCGPHLQDHGEEGQDGEGVGPDRRPRHQHEHELERLEGERVWDNYLNDALVDEGVSDRGSGESRACGEKAQARTRT